MKTIAAATALSTLVLTGCMTTSPTASATPSAPQAAKVATAPGPGAGGEFWQHATRVSSSPLVAPQQNATVLLGTGDRWASSPVWVFGDSITVGTYAPLQAKITAKGKAAVALDATSGIPSTPATNLYLLPRLKAAKVKPKVLVFALGSNDTVVDSKTGKPVGNPASTVANLRKVRAAAGPSTKIVFVEVFVKRASADRYRKGVQAQELANSRRINEEVRRSRLADAIVPWYAPMSKAPAAKAYLRDGVHTTPAGTEYRTTLMASTVASLLKKA